MDRIKNYINKPWNSTAMLSQAPISRSVWEHLIKVYCTLGYLFVFALFGAFWHLIFDCGGWITAFGFVGSVWLMSRIEPWREFRRVMIFMAAAFFLGATIGPLLNVIATVDQSTVINIIMGGFVFFSCYFVTCVIKITSNRTVIYAISEFSSPIFITTWIVLSETYPGLLSHVTLLVLLPFPWYVVLFMLKIVRNTLRIRFNVPIHLAWITLLCYCFNYPFHELLLVYFIVLGLLMNVKMHSQEAIFLATSGAEESYYVSTTITFFTEFLARTISLYIHGVGIMFAVLRTVMRWRRRRHEDVVA